MIIALIPAAAVLGTVGVCMRLANFSVSAKRPTMPLAAGTVMVTGASRGLGLEFVRQLVKLPSPPEVLIAACRNPETATNLQAIARTNPSVKIVKLDLEKDDDIEAVYNQSKALLGNRGLNLLINNAGLYDKADGTLPNQSRQMMQRHFDVNVSGPLMLTQKLLPLLKQAASKSTSSELSCSRAGVVMITSHMGSQAVTYKDQAGQAYHYKCSKTATTMAAVMMSRELKDYGIFVAAIHPGWVRTDMGSSYAPTLPEESIQGCLQVLGNVGGESTGKLLTYQGETLPY